MSAEWKQDNKEGNFKVEDEWWKINFLCEKAASVFMAILKRKVSRVS